MELDTGDLACTYAALILADDDIAITGDKISAILKAAQIDFVEPYMPGMYASALGDCNIKDLLCNIGSGGGAAAGPAAAAGGAAAPAEEEKKEEKKKEESDDDSDASMGFDLFG